MSPTQRRILITGANGFIGKNLFIRLNELSDFQITTFNRTNKIDDLQKILLEIDAVIHLAGECRPKNEDAFDEVNIELTSALCNTIQNIFFKTGRKITLIFASTTKVEENSSYGQSKLAAEIIVKNLGAKINNNIVIFRLPGVFGKWSKPNYNSVVATFCHNVANKLPIQVNNPVVCLTLVYVDDVVDAFISALDLSKGVAYSKVEPEYSINLGELAEKIISFDNGRTTLESQAVGSGLNRALYSTYISYLPPERFVYSLPQYRDSRGTFVEMLKTKDSGQFSFFTLLPGLTRGGHYHHTKSEKFLVIKGSASFRFRHLLTDKFVEIQTNGDCPQIVDTIPGWSHDIKNLGAHELIVMLWANEIFDRIKPDTVPYKVVNEKD